MKIVYVFVTLILCAGCASMPIIGPCSYLAAKSNEPVLGGAVGKETLGQSVWAATKATVGYAADAFLWGLAINAVDKELGDNDADKTDLPVLSGDGNVIIYNESGEVSYRGYSDSYNSGE